MGLGRVWDPANFDSISTSLAHQCNPFPLITATSSTDKDYKLSHIADLPGKARRRWRIVGAGRCFDLVGWRTKTVRTMIGCSRVYEKQAATLQPSQMAMEARRVDISAGASPDWTSYTEKQVIPGGPCELVWGDEGGRLTGSASFPFSRIFSPISNVSMLCYLVGEKGGIPLNYALQARVSRMMP
jgi:hypothetical protein